MSKFSLELYGYQSADAPNETIVEDDHPLLQADRIDFSQEAISLPIAPRGIPINESTDKTQDNAVRTKKLVFAKQVNKAGTRAAWTFYLNLANIDSKVLNVFLCRMRQVKAMDIVVVHLPSMCSIDWAEAIAGALDYCRAEHITLNAPYIASTAAAYILTRADYIAVSPYMLLQLDAPNISAAGTFQDAQAGLKVDLYRKARMLTALRDAKLITNEELSHISEHQGKICVFGDELVSRYEAFNQRKEK